jgi:glycerol-3-phosphate dehydrogenase
MPTLERAGLRGGILYYDGQFDDARLAISLAQTVADLNGVVVNYVKAVSLLKHNERICGIVARDIEGGGEFEVRARVVVNATGVFSDEVRHLDDVSAPGLLVSSQGAHIVLDKSFLPGDCALMSPYTADGRVFFAIPWHGRVLIGTTDTPAPKAVLEPRPLREEIEFLLAHAARHLARKPGPSDILSAFAGLRPLIDGGSGRKTSMLSRSHRVVVSPSGLVTITGGKWTTYRQMAEDTVNRAAAFGSLPARPSPTHDLKLHGWEETIKREAIFSEYGADALALCALCESTADGTAPLHPRLPYRMGQVRWAVRREMARTLEDTLSRRLRVLPVDAQASLEAATQVAGLMAAELGRDATWESQQVSKYRELVSGYLVQ